MTVAVDVSTGVHNLFLNGNGNGAGNHGGAEIFPRDGDFDEKAVKAILSSKEVVNSIPRGDEYDVDFS